LRDRNKVSVDSRTTNFTRVTALGIDVVKRLIPSRMTPRKITEARQLENEIGSSIRVANSISSFVDDLAVLFMGKPLNLIQIDCATTGAPTALHDCIMTKTKKPGVTSGL
jgi:hypothetical protein